jgi:hypothetical protein
MHGRQQRRPAPLVAVLLVAGDDQHDLAAPVALGELGVGGADVVERVGVLQRDLHVLGRRERGEFA